MNVTCRCGARLGFRAEQYPHKVDCHVCGRQLAVLDDGTIIETNKEDAARTTAYSTAIQVEPMSTFPPSPAEETRIAAGESILETTGVQFPDTSKLKAKRPKWHLALFSLSLLAVLTLAVDFFFMAQGIYWVGFRDLEITFVVTDAQTNEPIAGAEIDIPESQNGFCSECDDAFRLVTDAQGTAKRMCKQCMCSGYSGRKPFFRRVDTFGTHIPDWMPQISAAGFSNSGPFSVGEPAFRRTVRRGVEFATMEVSVMLFRLPGKK